MDLPPLPPPFEAKPAVQHVSPYTPTKTDAQWGRPIFRAPELRPLTLRKKEGVFPERPAFKGRVRDKRTA